MKLFPRGLYLPVHCCCDPTLRLGWIPVPATKRAGSPLRIAICSPPRTRVFGDGVPAQAEIIYIDAEVAWLTTSEQSVLAVKSGHQPVEVWRRVNGFIENRAVPSLPAMRSRAARWSVAAPCASSDPRGSDETP